MLVMTLQSLGDNPFAWGAAGAILALAFVALWRYRTCPYLAGEAGEAEPGGDPAAARRFLDARIAQGPGYLALMLLGIGTLITGLAMVAKDLRPEAGFYLLVLGVVVVQTQPILSRIRIATARVIAAEADEDRRGAARAELRDMHRGMVLSLFALAACVALGLLAF